MNMRTHLRSPRLRYGSCEALPREGDANRSFVLFFFYNSGLLCFALLILVTLEKRVEHTKETSGGLEPGIVLEFILFGKIRYAWPQQKIRKSLNVLYYVLRY